jgi:hypothetical protein
LTMMPLHETSAMSPCTPVLIRNISCVS